MGVDLFAPHPPKGGELLQQVALKQKLIDAIQVSNYMILPL